MPTVHSSLAPGSDFRLVRASRAQGPEFRLRARHLCVAPTVSGFISVQTQRKQRGSYSLREEEASPLAQKEETGAVGGGGPCCLPFSRVETFLHSADTPTSSNLNNAQPQSWPAAKAAGLLKGGQATAGGEEEKG